MKKYNVVVEETIVNRATVEVTAKDHRDAEYKALRKSESGLESINIKRLRFENLYNCRNVTETKVL